MNSFLFDDFVVEDFDEGLPEGSLEVWTRDEPREWIGRFDFRCIDENDDRLILVTWMHLEGPGSARAHIRKGIGSAVIDIKRGQACRVFFQYPDGPAQDDGSHLTDLGRPFAIKMVETGKANWVGGPGSDDDD